MTNLDNNEADVSFEALGDIVLTAADIDVATMILSLPSTPGFQEVLCQATVFRQAWVPADGTASSASRHVHTEPGLALRKGDYLAFHMDHAGVGVDGEMQVALGYLASERSQR